MARSPFISLPYNPAILSWARRLGNYSYEDAANAVEVSPNRIKEWENKTSVPTVRQARILAAFYRRPFLEFFAESIPQLEKTELVPDFRMSKDKLAPVGNKLRQVQEWAESQRLNAIDLFEINTESVPVFPKTLYATENDEPENAANRARKAINFTIENQLLLKGNEKQNLFKILRGKLEQVGVLVFKDSQLRENNARGLCIYFEILPIVIVGSESQAGSAFTLIHELGHIILRQSAISGSAIPKTSNQSIFRIESWCNKFAGAFLMPGNSIKQFLPYKRMVPEISDDELRNYARKFSVSEHAMLVRLVQLGIVNSNYYWEVKRPQFLIQESQFKATGRSTYYGSRYRSHNGDLYTGLVLDAWTSGKITNHSAAEYMGIKNLTHLFDIRKNFNGE